MTPEGQARLRDELKKLNDKMEKVISILQTGEVQVKVAKPDEDKGAAKK